LDLFNNFLSPLKAAKEQVKKLSQIAEDKDSSFILVFSTPH